MLQLLRVLISDNRMMVPTAAATQDADEDNILGMWIEAVNVLSNFF